MEGKFILSESRKLRMMIGVSSAIFVLIIGIFAYFTWHKSKAINGKLAKAQITKVTTIKGDFRITVSFRPYNRLKSAKASFQSKRRYTSGDSVFIKYDPQDCTNIAWVADIYFDKK